MERVTGGAVRGYLNTEEERGNIYTRKKWSEHKQETE